MHCYIDFEANCVNNEIISIGAIVGDKKFYSLVRPHRKLDHNIKILTGITQEQAEAAETIDVVIESFMNWLKEIDSDYNFTFINYGSADKEFINRSIDLSEKEFTKVKLNWIAENMKNVDKEVSIKFNRSLINLRSAYLTMLLSSADEIPMTHNALDDAGMLKYVHEHIEEYSLPEGVDIVKVKKFNLRYGKKREKVTKNLVPKGTNIKQEIKKYNYPIKVVGENSKGKTKEWHFPNSKGALPLIHPSRYCDKRVKLNDLMRIENAIKTGEELDGFIFSLD